MRKTAPVAISMSLALILALLSTEMRTSVVTAKAEGSLLAAATNSSMSRSPLQENIPFIWALPNEEKRYRDYGRVEGGKHQDGTMMYICRFFSIPGKLYKDGCHYSDGGYEYVRDSGYEILLSDAGYEWRPFNSVSRSQIKSTAFEGGVDPHNQNDTLYICRKKMSDGVHPGKYSYKNNLCYIPWGNKEVYFARGFEILFHRSL